MRCIRRIVAAESKLAVTSNKRLDVVLHLSRNRGLLRNHLLMLVLRLTNYILLWKYQRILTLKVVVPITRVVMLLLLIHVVHELLIILKRWIEVGP